MTRPVRPHFNQRIAQNQDRARIRNLERRIIAERFIPVVFDGVGNVLAPGVWGDVPVHFDGTILRFNIDSVTDITKATLTLTLQA